MTNSTLAFGSYNPVSGSATFSNATITVTCSALLGLGNSETVSYTMLLSAGASGSTASRRMTSGAMNLPYNIYTGASYSTVWDNSTGVGGSFTLTGPLGLPLLVSGSDSKTAYGRISASLAVRSGTYADSLVITVNY